DPKPLPAGTKIIIRAVFDNSARNPANPDPSQEVRWGLQSKDEMLVGYFMYSTGRQDSGSEAAFAQASELDRTAPPGSGGSPLTASRSAHGYQATKRGAGAATPAGSTP
ncbi:MAG: hypothetical protein L0191_01935, partial [Acidobacteria bacterium]|nr:hypothetical protein [Acidobacteriota bacterium]